jgi:hypothetical protein
VTMMGSKPTENTRPFKNSVSLQLMAFQQCVFSGNHVPVPNRQYPVRLSR